LFVPPIITPLEAWLRLFWPPMIAL
jgi:hypothetical protein